MGDLKKEGKKEKNEIKRLIRSQKRRKKKKKKKKKEEEEEEEKKRSIKV